MTEDDYREQLWDEWPEIGDLASPDLVELARRAVMEHPQSAVLHVMLGDILQLSRERGDTTLSVEIIALYRLANTLDPEAAEPLESLGFYVDSHFDDYDLAEWAFREAILRRDAGEWCYYGLARVLAQRGEKWQALNLISPSKCIFSSCDCIKEIRTEIINGQWYHPDEPDEELDEPDATTPPEPHPAD